MTASQDAKTLSQERFTRFADGYVSSSTHAKGQELERLIELAQPQANWFALDVATGGGHTALKFAPFVAHVTATDITPAMLEKAEAFAGTKGVENIAFQPADAENLPFEANTFDLVTCRIAPHHFADVPRFLRESARVLKTGGLLLVQDHSMPEDKRAARYIDQFERLRDPSHNRAFSKSEWQSMFEAAGLSMVHSEQVVKVHRLYPWAERQGCKPEVIQRLVSTVEEAPEAVKDWMQPRDFGTADATFVNYHIIIAGRKR